MPATLIHEMQKLLKRLFLTIAKGEKSIERQRQRLASNRAFEPFAAFKRIDRHEMGSISPVELLHFLRYI